jgi:hypothetical protein
MMQRQQVQGCHDSTIDINIRRSPRRPLEELGLVKRCADPEDRRIWRLRITPEAAPILRKIELFRVELHELMTMEIDPWFLDAMVIGLHQMKESLSSSRRLAKASREERDSAARGPANCNGCPLFLRSRGADSWRSFDLLSPW